MEPPAPAMILMAAMTVPWNGPEKVSGEVEQGLDLSGKWQGLRWRGNGEVRRFFIDKGEAWCEPLVIGSRKIRIILNDFNVVDEGAGAFRWYWETEGFCQFGIYKWDYDSLVLCLRETGKGRPTSFRVDENQSLFILHRVKPGK